MWAVIIVVEYLVLSYFDAVTGKWRIPASPVCINYYSVFQNKMYNFLIFKNCNLKDGMGE